MKPLYAALLVLAACCPPRGASAPAAPVAAALSPEDAALAAKLDAAVVKTLEGRPAPGISVAVMHKGAVVLAKGYKLADVAHQTPVTADTRFRIGSITKSFTARAILALAADGKLAIDDPLTKFLPDYPMQGKTVTVRQLLTHTSGIKSYTDMDAFWKKQNEAFSRAEMVAMFAAEPFTFEPGTKWAYNNSGYYLLGLIIEKVTGKPYADAVQELVIAPAGLTATAYCPPDMDRDGFSRGYSMSPDGPVLAEPLDMQHPYAAGSLCSTAGDLARWAEALAADEATFAQMTTPVTLSDGSTHPYGFGLQVGTVEGHREIHHGGGINGFVSMLTYFPEEQLTIIVLSNLEGPLAGDLSEILTRAAFDIPEPVVIDKPLSEAAAAAYVGLYEITVPGETVVIKVRFRYQNGTMESANLDDKGEPGRWVKMNWQGGEVFELPEVKAKISFTVANGRATTIDVEQGGQKFSGTRAGD